MKKTILALLLFIVVLPMAFSIGAQVGSHSPTDSFSPSINNEYPSVSTSWVDTESLSGATGNAIPIICDSDEDGEDEVHVYSGRTISIYGMDSTNAFVLESTLEMSNVGDINALGCVDLAGDNANKDILFTHQGTTNGTSWVLFVEHEPEWFNINPEVASVTNGIENGYYLAGYINGTINGSSEFYCSQRGSGWVDEDEFDCVYANEHGFATVRFTDWEDSSVTGYRFPVHDDSQLDPNFSYPEIEWCFLWGTCDTLSGDSVQVWQNQTLRLEFESDAGSGGNERAIAVVHGATPNLYVYALDNPDLIKFTVDDINASNWEQETQTARTFTSWTYLSPLDYSDDGSDDVCLSASGHASPLQDGWISCLTPASDTEVYYNQIGATGGFEQYLAPVGFDTDGDGNTNACLSSISNAVYSFSCFGAGTGDFSTTAQNSVINAQVGGVARVRGLENYTAMIFGSDIFFYNNSNSSEEGFDTVSGIISFFADLNNDYELEVVSYDPTGGGTTLYSISALETTGTITLQNPNQTGDGYFGWFAGDNCNATAVTFEAVECFGDDTDCTYSSSSASSQERLCSTCGDTQSLTCGSWSYAHPVLDCALPVGDYEITLYIESDYLSGYYQGANDPAISLTVIDGLEGSTCNVLGDQYETPSTLPDQTTNETTTEEVSVLTPPTADKNEQPVLWLFQYLTQNIPPALKFLISVMIIVGLAIYASNATNHNPIMTVVGAICGAGIAVVLGLLAVEVVLIVGIGLVITIIAIRVIHARSGGV